MIPVAGFFLIGFIEIISQVMVVREFLGKRGIASRKTIPTAIPSSPHEIAEQHVIVCLQGPVNAYIDSIPFHTSVLEWDLGPTPVIDDIKRFEELYRELALQVEDLMEVLHGEGAR